MCDCIRLQINGDNGYSDFTLETAGQYNGQNYWTFTYSGFTYFIYFLGGGGNCWLVGDALGTGNILTRHCPTSGNICSKAPMSPDTPSNDPVTMWNFIFQPIPPFGNLTQFETEQTACPVCDIQQRTKREYKSIKLPENFAEQKRGADNCCCEYNVLGNAGSETWKNDITSAWIKASSPSDLVEFKLVKNGVDTILTKESFINEPNAFYCTVNWGDILASTGVGCYELQILYTIAGVVDNLIWGVYNLEQYSIQSALGTARVRAFFNSYNEIDQINFTGTNVESSFRFAGYIGNRQPNTEIDNIIYGNREMKRVIRENLNTYEIITDPALECITRPLIELFLLSENELFVSDYNAQNHSYRYNDLPVIVEESANLEYYNLSRKAKLTCVVSDKYKTKRTYY